MNYFLTVRPSAEIFRFRVVRNNAAPTSGSFRSVNSFSFTDYVCCAMLKLHAHGYELYSPREVFLTPVLRQLSPVRVFALSELHARQSTFLLGRSLWVLEDQIRKRWSVAFSTELRRLGVCYVEWSI